MTNQMKDNSPLDQYVVVKKAGTNWRPFWGSGDPKITGVVKGMSAAHTEAGKKVGCAMTYPSREEAQRMADLMNSDTSEFGDYAVCPLIPDVTLG